MRWLIPPASLDDVVISVDGLLANFSDNLKKEEALLVVAGYVLRTVLLVPYGMLIFFVSAVRESDTPCVGAFDNSQEIVQPTNLAAASPTEAVENLLGVFN